MMRIAAVLWLALVIAATELLIQRHWIGWMRMRRIGQIIKEYGPRSHEIKAGTPSMGGVAIMCATLVGIVLAEVMGLASMHDLAAIWFYPFAAGAVGFADDWLKNIKRSSEGLRSLQKLAAQILVTLPWAAGMAWNGLHITPEATISFVPGVVLLMIFGVGFLNAFNVTDGLDGLAGGCGVISLVAFLLIFEASVATLSAVIGIACVAAFLWHNAMPATVFMGDLGSHFLGGLLISLCVWADSFIYTLPIGFIFGIELITVAIQIVAIRGFGRKVFRMSPVHHHFELIGWSEQKVVTRFWLVHAAGLTTLTAAVAMIFGGR